MTQIMQIIFLITFAFFKDVYFLTPDINAINPTLTVGGFDDLW